MKRVWILWLVIGVVVLLGCGIGWHLVFNQPDLTVITVKEPAVAEVYSKVYVSEFLTIEEGELVKDVSVDTTKLGEVTTKVTYWNSNHRKKTTEVTVLVQDTTEPYIDLNDAYRIALGSSEELTDEIMCADNYDPNPTCTIEGEYNADAPGTYPLVYQAVDNSGNITRKEFTLTVRAPSTGGSSTNEEGTELAHFIENYQTEDSKIGIDVSKWQGSIDWQSVKDGGVNFVLMRLGTQKGIGEDSKLDDTFVKNVEGARAVGLDVGVYYYSYASSIKEVKEQAKWVVKQLKPYQLTLPVAFDWECWSLFNELGISIYDLNKIATTFSSELQKQGYDTLLYGSKKYLENIWDTEAHEVWLAHYTDQTTYQKRYRFWQLSNTGKVPGIDGFVDIDVMYEV